MHESWWVNCRLHADFRKWIHDSRTRSGSGHQGCGGLGWPGHEGSFQSLQLQDEGEAPCRGGRVVPFVLLSLSAEHQGILNLYFLPGGTLPQGGPVWPLFQRLHHVWPLESVANLSVIIPGADPCEAAENQSKSLY